MSRTPLYLIAAPIGNHVEDLSEAGLDALRAVRHVFTEGPAIFHDKLRERGVLRDDHVLHTMDDRRNPEAARLLAAGEPIAILPATGLPCFVDPGWDIVAWVLDHALDRVELVPVGMSSALDAALCMSGLEFRQFVFLGHVPLTSTWHAPLVQSGLPLVWYVDGTAITSFLTELSSRVVDVRRVVLFKNIRRRSGSQVVVLRGPDLVVPEEIEDERRHNWVAVVVREGRTYLAR